MPDQTAGSQWRMAKDKPECLSYTVLDMFRCRRGGGALSWTEKSYRMAVTVHVFLAYPLPASFPLPPFDRRSVRYAYQLQVDSPAAATNMELLEEVFRLLNVSHPTDYLERSLSVGDVLTIAESRSYLCDLTGWIPLNMPVKCGGLNARLQPTDGNSETKSLPA
jgi:hypothetical protein